MVSIIIPFYNEEDNVPVLMGKFKQLLNLAEANDYEIICIDDGSTDNTFAELKKSSEKFSNMLLIRLARNFGQTSAIEAGFEHVNGDVILIMDGDMQNDPSDIPNLLNKLKEGFDVVSGWRRFRKDSLMRKILSYIGNKAISLISGVKLRDYGCSLKAYKKDILKDIQLWGELHRILPVYAALNGARISEIEVSHHPRKHGRSKYTLLRGFKLIADLITAKFMGTFATRPNYLFGIAGITFFILCWFLVMFTFIFNIKRGILMSFLFFIMGFQLLIIGLFAEILMRLYYFIRGKPTYIAKEIVRGPKV